jgi:hypothetical protein
MKFKLNKDAARNANEIVFHIIIIIGVVMASLAFGLAIVLLALIHPFIAALTILAVSLLVAWLIAYYISALQ